MIIILGEIPCIKKSSCGNPALHYRLFLKFRGS